MLEATEMTVLPAYNATSDDVHPERLEPEPAIEWFGSIFDGLQVKQSV